MFSSSQGQSHGPSQLLDQPSLAAPSAVTNKDHSDRDRDDSDLSDIDLPLPQSPSPSPSRNPPARPHPQQHQHRPRVIHSSPIASSSSPSSSPAPRPQAYHCHTRSPSLSSSDVSSIPPSSPLHDPMDVDDDDSLHIDDDNLRKPAGGSDSSQNSGNDSDADMSDYRHDSRGRSRVRRPRSSASSASDASSDRSSVRLSSLSASPTATANDGRQKKKQAVTGSKTAAREEHGGGGGGGGPIRRRITSSSSSVSSVSSVGTLSSSSSRSSSPPKQTHQASPARKQRLAPLPIHAQKDGSGSDDDDDDDGGSSSGDSDGPVGPGSRSGAGGGTRRVLPSSPDSPMDHKIPAVSTSVKQEPGHPSSAKPTSFKPKKDAPKATRPVPISTASASATRNAGAPLRPPSAGDPTETPLTSPLLPKRRGSVQPTTTGTTTLTNVDARKDTSGRTRLFKAVSRGDLALVMSLVNAGANVNHKDHAGWTPLHEAVLARREAIVELLLERGANPNAQGLHGNTPLHDADTEEYLPVARMLLKYGASVSVRNEDGVAPVENPDAEDDVTALLTAYGVLEDALLRRDRCGMTLLHRCCWELGQQFETPRKGSSARSSNAAEWLRPSPELIQELVACRRVDVNVSDNAGWTPLHELVAQKRVPLVQLLLRHGADVNARGFRGITPLHEAAKGRGHVELVRLLLDHGADPRAVTDGSAGGSGGLTPIDMCEDPELKRVMAEYPYRATRADEVRRQLLEEIARTSGGVHGDWQSGSAAHGSGQGGASVSGPAAHVETAETVLSDPGGGAGGGGLDESKSERSRDDAASTSTHQQRSGASYGGGACGDPRKMTREERLMASYIARIERQEQRKQQQQQSGKGAGEGSASGAKRKKSSATGVDIGKAAEKAVEKAAAGEPSMAAGARSSKGDGDQVARESKSASGASKSKSKDGGKKASTTGSTKSRESPALTSSLREKADKSDASKPGPSRPASSTKSTKLQQPSETTSFTADGHQRASKKRARSSSATATATLDPSIRVDDLPHYCTTGDAARVAKALNLPGVIPVLPKAILAASRAGHVELVRVVVDRLASAHSSGAATAAANLTGGKPVLSVQQVVTAALHQAVKQEHVDVAGYLLSKGAKATARNRAGQTPIEQARVLGNKVLVSLLEQAASGSSSGLGAAASGAAGGSGSGRAGGQGAADEDAMMEDDKMTVVVMKDSVVLATSSKSSAKGPGASSASGKRKAAAIKVEEDDLSDTDVDSDTAPPPPKKAKTAGSMGKDRARGPAGAKQHQQGPAAHHSSTLLSSLGFKDPSTIQDVTSAVSNRAGASSNQRTSARRNSSSSSSTPLLPNAQLPTSAADRRRASLLEQGGESGGTSPEISVVDSPRRTPSTIGPLTSTGSPILAIQFGTRFLVLEPDVRGHVSVPSAGQVFRAPSQREIFALMDSPAASSLRPGLPPPRVAMLDELIAAVHAAGAGSLPVQFTSWRPPSSSTPVSPPKRNRTRLASSRAAGGSGKQTSPGLTTPTHSPRSQHNKRRPADRVLPPKVMFKHMQRRSAGSSSSAK